MHMFCSSVYIHRHMYINMFSVYMHRHMRLTLTCKCTCGRAMFLLMPSYADVSVVLQHHPPYIILAKFAHHARASHLTKNRARGPDRHEALMSVLSEDAVCVDLHHVVNRKGSERSCGHQIPAEKTMWSTLINPRKSAMSFNSPCGYRPSEDSWHMLVSL